MGRAFQWAVAAVMLAALTTAAAPVLAEDYYDGLRAYDSGDHGRAARIWRDAALSGDARAQFRLGQLYENGEGVERDYVEALGWYILAQEQGNADAGVSAYFLRRNMTEAQQERAQEQAGTLRDRVARHDGRGADSDADVRSEREQPDRGRGADERRNRAVASDRRDTETPSAQAESGEPRVEWWSRQQRSEQQGEPIPDAKLRAMIAGSEVRDAVEVDGRVRYDLWQFRGDGTVHGTFSAAAPSGRPGEEQGLDDGVWEVRDGLLCIAWDRWYDGRETCYRVVVSRGGAWRLFDAETGAPAGDSVGHAVRRVR